jgi:hypothetical protein
MFGSIAFHDRSNMILARIYLYEKGKLKRAGYYPSGYQPFEPTVIDSIYTLGLSENFGERFSAGLGTSSVTNFGSSCFSHSDFSMVVPYQGKNSVIFTQNGLQGTFFSRPTGNLLFFRIVD